MRFILCVCTFLYFFSFVFSILDITTHPNWTLVNDEYCGIALTDRIIGGRVATLGQFPWLAQLGYGSRKGVVPKQFRFRCGGALINKYNILTAAHCVLDLPEGQYVDIVRLGEYNTKTSKDCDDYRCAPPVQDIKVHKVTYHSNYSKPIYKNDITILLLSTPAVYNGWVAPICLPFGKLIAKTYVGEMAEVAGWGLYNISSWKTSERLLFVKVPVQNIEICTAVYQKHATVGPGQLCAGGIFNEDSCEGDSGGALTKVEAVKGPPRHYLIGIVSFGPKDCGSTIPAVYTNVAYYLEWILKNV